MDHKCVWAESILMTPIVTSYATMLLPHVPCGQWYNPGIIKSRQSVFVLFATRGHNILYSDWGEDTP